jgi:aminoglycoside 3-N-acetyltransferase
LALNRAGNVILHSSLKSMSYVVGGRVAIIAAIERLPGHSGTLVMPTFAGQLSDPED